MSNLLLDTSAYSAFFRDHKGIKQEIRQAQRLILNPIILGELHAGFLKGNKTTKNLNELERFLSHPLVEIFTVDEVTAERYAVILTSLRNAGTPIPANDIWIAATAYQYGLTLLTLDAHFKTVNQVHVKHFS